MDGSPHDPRGSAPRSRLSLWINWSWAIILTGFIFYHAIAILARVQTFTVVVIGAVFFAYLIYPVIVWLNRRMALGAAVGVVYFAIALLVALGLTVALPALSNDAQQLAHDAPSYVAHAQQILNNPYDPLTSHLPAGVRAWLIALPTTIQSNVGGFVGGAASRLIPVLLSIVSIGALFVLIPVVAAYMILEADTLKATFIGYVPERARPKTLKIIADLDHVVGGFIRGQLIVAAVVGSLVAILLLVLHVPYAALIGVIAGVLDVIPYVGAIAGWLPAFLIALFVNGWENALFVTIGIVAINQLEGHLLAPLIVSRSVELTPLAVILALLAGGELAGIPGLLLAVPVAGMIRVLIMNFRGVAPATEQRAEPAVRAHRKSAP